MNLSLWFFHLFANYSLLMLFIIFIKYEEYSWLIPLESTYFLAPRPSLCQLHTDNNLCHFSEKINKFVGKCSNQIFYFNLPKMVLITTSWFIWLITFWYLRVPHHIPTHEIDSDPSMVIQMNQQLYYRHMRKLCKQSFT